MSRSLEIVFLEPYYGGSHAHFADAFAANTRHRCRLVTLPARNWKWRMRGSAAWFTRFDNEWLDAPLDVILCSDMLSVADLRAMLPAGRRDVPIICYFHENQLTYPLSPDDRPDYHYGMTNILTCLASDRVWFNSRHHQDAFIAAARALLLQMPDFEIDDVCQDILDRSEVQPPPVGPPADASDLVPRRGVPPESPVRILWCHRWEFDKNPEPFFQSLIDLDQEGQPFELVLVGEQFRAAPAVFSEAWNRLVRHIVHSGYVPDRKTYWSLLSSCDLVVSTAIQENFGIAVVEAIQAGCQPLLPNRLVYPEILPEHYHEACLFALDNDPRLAGSTCQGFGSDDTLTDSLRRLVAGSGWLPEAARSELSASVRTRYEPTGRVAAMDEALAAVATASGWSVR